MSDQALFEKLYDDTHKDVVKYVAVRCHPLDIEDVVQEVYAEVYRTIQTKGIDYIQNNKSFIIHIAKTKVSYFYRMRKKNPIFLSVEDEFQDIEDVTAVDWQQDIEDSLLTLQSVNLIWNEIKSMPEDTQRIIYLFYYCDLTISQIACEFNISESNVKNKLYRAMKKISANLVKEEHNEAQ
jgi:RNA polymerase sigma factor (sigma-70 family)